MQIASSLMTPIQWALKACEAIMAKSRKSFRRTGSTTIKAFFCPVWRNAGGRPENRSCSTI